MITDANASVSDANRPIVREYREEDRSRWNEFVNACPQATFFHRAEWKSVIESAFNHQTYFMYAEDSRGAIRGVLPLVHVRSHLFGNALTSTPFCVYGGVAAVDDVARAALDSAASALADRLDVDCLEMRSRDRMHPDWPVKDLYVTFRKSIDPDIEKNMQAIPRKQRAMVRKGIGNGLISVVDSGVDRFYDMYSESVRNLGTPVFGKAYARILKQTFGDACEIMTVEHESRPICSVMNFYFRDEVLPYYGGGTGSARGLAANDFMYWEVMRRACERGLGIFDYGRSKIGTGSFSFKKNWGFEPQPLNYEYYLVRAKVIPEVNPLNPKYRVFISLWKHMPVSVANRLGPLLARSLG